MAETDKHVDELTLMRWADSELTRAREEAAREHLLSCAHCQSSFEAIKAETELLRAATLEEDEALPEHIRPRQSDVSWFLVAVIAFGALGFTTVWNQFVRPLVENMEDVGDLDGGGLAITILVRSVLWRGWLSLWSQLSQGVLLVVLFGIGALALNWAWKRFRSSPAASLVLVSAIAAALPAGSDAAVVVVDEARYELESGETIDTDLIVAAERIRIDGVVVGDLIVAGGDVLVNGTVEGDILGLAEEIQVTGQVGGNIRAAARLIEVVGVVRRNVTAAAENVRIQPGAELGGSLFSASRSTVIDAPVGRDVLAVAQEHEIHARIGGSVTLAGNTLNVGPSAEIEGETVFYGAQEPYVSPEATLSSAIDFNQIESGDEDDDVVDWIASFVYFWAAAFVFGAAITLVSPEMTESIVTRYVPDSGKSFLVGVLVAVATLVLATLMLLTFVGIPLSLATFFVWGFGHYLGRAYVASWLGRQILGTPTSASQGLVRLALGLLLIHAGMAVPVLGLVVLYVVSTWGFGALTLYAYSQLPWTADSSDLTPAGAA